MRFGDRSLRFKLSFVTVLTIVVVLALFGLGAAIYLRHVLEQQTTEELVRQNGLVHDMVVSADESMRVPAAKTAEIFSTTLQGKTWSMGTSARIKSGDRDAPRLKMDEEVVNDRFDEVDAFSAQTGGLWPPCLPRMARSSCGSRRASRMPRADAR